MTGRALHRLPGIVVAAAAAVLGAVLLALLAATAPPSAADGGCGQVETARSQRDVNPRGAEPFAFGDSVMHPAQLPLARQGYHANSQGCRSFEDGLKILRRLRARGKLPHLVVMALGTDGRVTKSAIEQTLGVLGRSRVLGLVTPRESGGGAKFDAITMRRVAKENPRQVVLLDWVKYSRGRGGWFQPDGTHLSIPRGAQAFAAFLGRATRFARTGSFPNGAVFPAP